MYRSGNDEEKKILKLYMAIPLLKAEEVGDGVRCIRSLILDLEENSFKEKVNKVTVFYFFGFNSSPHMVVKQHMLLL